MVEAAVIETASEALILSPSPTVDSLFIPKESLNVHDYFTMYQLFKGIFKKLS